ncbi:trifunctional dihydropteroate synthetase [Paramarasmius palmivorus]|uniref:Trifunctional dihydropteroate synthetase n=1 Tax=Paramarasmius palmivorus TaxID=297713 RepID=A0AAW0CQ70_9AGAR
MLDRWPPKTATKPTAQPLLISLAIPHNIRGTAETDDLSQSINYSTLASTLRTSLSPVSLTDLQPIFPSLEAITSHAFDLLLSHFSSSAPALQGAWLKVTQVKPPLHCKTVGIESQASSTKGAGWHSHSIRHLIEDLECKAIIGVNAAERLERQLVQINISIEHDGGFDLGKDSVDFRSLTRRLYDSVEKTTYLTLEALASYIALETLRELRQQHANLSPKVTIKAAKPYALVFAGSSEVEIRRTIEDYRNELDNPSTITQLPESGSKTHTVAIAIGSNIGDSYQNIEQALRLLEQPHQVLNEASDIFLEVIDTSFLYESAPMYVTEQPSFINCACMVETNLKPLHLLALLKKIEELVGRVPSIRNGPRAIDLDIVLYDNAVIDTRPVGARQDLGNLEGELVVPHPRMAEREFVLRPLYDMMPDYIHPVRNMTIHTLLKELLFSSKDAPMKRVIPFPQLPVSPQSTLPPATLTRWTYPIPGYKDASGGMKTYLMAILNVTPDSFSDGSEHDTLPTALSCVRDAVDGGADIIDVGGYSTRPGAAFVSEEQEIERVVPVIAAVRKADGASHVPISVDTFRPGVARAAILAGANCINDVHAFTGSESYPYSTLTSEERMKAEECMAEMKNIAREYAVPIVLMHSRGDAGKNKDYSFYGYARDSGVLEGVRIELGNKVDAIVKGRGGVRRWMVIVDPGVGFSKSVEDNLETMRNASSVVADMHVGSDKGRRRNPLAGFPQLIGPSRKSFLGQILSTKHGKTCDPHDRVWATGATVSCAVQQGATVVRVHDVKEMRDIVSISDSLWK